MRPLISFVQAVESNFLPEVVEDWYSPAIKAKTTCTRTARFKTFPKVRRGGRKWEKRE